MSKTYVVTFTNKTNEKEFLAYSDELATEMDGEPAAGYFWTTDGDDGKVLTFARLDVAKERAKYWNGAKVEAA